MSTVPDLPPRKDLTIYQGNDFAMMLGLKYYDFATSTYKLLDTTGYTAKMRVRAAYDTALLLEMSTTNGRVAVGIQGTAPNQYNLSLTCPNSVTAALTDWGLGVYDIKLIDAFSHEQTVLYGTCCLQREVSY